MKMDTFQGYRRAVGRPGIRNHLLVLNVTGLTEAAARRVKASLPMAVLASSQFGIGMLGEDAGRTFNTLCGMALNPNCGAVLVIGADRRHVNRVTKVVRTNGKPCEAVCLDETDYDSLTLTDTAIRAGTRLVRQLSRQRREAFGPDELYVGMECGLSDPTSGLAANPLLGRLSDDLERIGATIVVGETLEWLGTEHQLSKRGRSAAVARDIVAAVSRLEERAIRAGISLTGINPNAANIRSGLTTIEEKASGSVAKTGTAEIQSVLDYGQVPPCNGLHLMDAPSSSPESLTGFVSSGVQIVLFTTGLGNSYCSAIAPTLKISANEASVRVLPEQIDFDASAFIQDNERDRTLALLMREINEIADGALTIGEITGEGNEVISRIGATL